MSQRRPVACRRARENRLSCRPGRCPGVNQASSLSTPSPGAGEPRDDPGFVDSGDVGGAVAVGVADLEIGPAEHVHQADQLDVGADLFAGVPDRGPRRATRPRPRRRPGHPSHRRGRQADQQHPACPVDGQD